MPDCRSSGLVNDHDRSTFCSTATVLNQLAPIHSTMMSYLLIMALVAFCSSGDNRANSEDWGCRLVGSDAELFGEADAPVAAVPRKDEATRAAWVPLHFLDTTAGLTGTAAMGVERVTFRGRERLRIWRFPAVPGRGPPQVS